MLSGLSDLPLMFHFRPGSKQVRKAQRCNIASFPASCFFVHSTLTCGCRPCFNLIGNDESARQTSSESTHGCRASLSRFPRPERNCWTRWPQRTQGSAWHSRYLFCTITQNHEFANIREPKAHLLNSDGKHGELVSPVRF